MKLSLAAVCAAAAAFVAPAAASAATLTIAPAKECYRSGEAVLDGRRAASPRARPVNVDRQRLDARRQPARPRTPPATIGSGLTLGQSNGQQQKTLVATDATNPALTASATLLVSAVTVNVKPKNGAAGRTVKIGARGFTTGKTLYAHISKGGRIVAQLQDRQAQGRLPQADGQAQAVRRRTPRAAPTRSSSTPPGSARRKTDRQEHLHRHDLPDRQERQRLGGERRRRCGAVWTLAG